MDTIPAYALPQSVIAQLENWLKSRFSDGKTAQPPLGNQYQGGPPRAPYPPLGNQYQGAPLAALPPKPIYKRKPIIYKALKKHPFTPSFITGMKKIDNAGKTGRSTSGSWFPHKSAEGGTDTIGYGHKLSKDEHEDGYVVVGDKNIPHGKLTDAHIETLLVDDMNKHKAIARNQFNKHGHGKDYDSMSRREQDLFGALAFNIGTLEDKDGNFGWPGLLKAVNDKDYEGIKRESLTSFTREDGTKGYLINRRDDLLKALDFNEKTYSR
jgi:GH24 family phage-related lysozyme (muramidase)